MVLAGMLYDRSINVTIINSFVLSLFFIKLYTRSIISHSRRKTTFKLNNKL